MVLGDRHELQQVLLNLVNNAVHAVSQLEAGRPRRIRLETTAPGRDGDPARVRLGARRPAAPGELSLHAVLHHQGAGRRHRARALAQLRHGEGARRRARLRGAARGRGGVPHFPAGLPGARRPAGRRSRSRKADRALRRILVVDDDPGGTPHGERAVHAPGRRGGGGAVRHPGYPDAEGARLRSGRRGCDGGGGPVQSSSCRRWRRSVPSSAAGWSWEWRATASCTRPRCRPGSRGARKPFNLRELNAVAQEIFASTPPRSPAATEGR